jgi:hypothetical protein
VQIGADQACVLAERGSRNHARRPALRDAAVVPGLSQSARRREYVVAGAEPTIDWRPVPAPIESVVGLAACLIRFTSGTLIAAVRRHAHHAAVNIGPRIARSRVISGVRRLASSPRRVCCAARTSRGARPAAGPADCESGEERRQSKVFKCRHGSFLPVRATAAAKAKDPF